MKKEEIYRILGDAYFSDNPHEKDALPALAAMLSTASLFIDVGASLGQFTRLASRSMRHGEIIAVEADPIRFEELQRNCKLWESESGNRITAVHAAISDSEGVLRFQTTNSNVSGGLVRHAVDGCTEPLGWSEIEVGALTLDALCGDRVPDVIKMDIEGAELAALTAAVKCLSAKKTRLVVEIHTFPELGGRSNRDRVVGLMRGFGYEGVPFFDKHLFAPAGTFSLPEKLGFHCRQWGRRLLRLSRRAFSRKASVPA